MLLFQIPSGSAVLTAAWCSEKHLEPIADPGVNPVDSLPWMINGDYRHALSVEDRGLHYGDGLFETIRLSQQIPINRAQHMSRLHDDLSTLQIPASMDLVERYLDQYLCETKLPPLARLKVIVTRGGPARGYAGDQSMPATIAIGAAPYTDIDESDRQLGIRLRLCTMPLSSNPTLAGIKHLNRLEQVLARSEWQDERIFEGLMLDADKSIVEGTMSNVFLVKNSVLTTPRLDMSGVRGVMRSVVIQHIAPSLGLEVIERPVSLEDLRLADEVFITNSLIGALAVQQCDQFFWRPGPVSFDVQKAIAQREHATVHSQ